MLIEQLTTLIFHRPKPFHSEFENKFSKSNELHMKHPKSWKGERKITDGFISEAS